MVRLIGCFSHCTIKAGGIWLQLSFSFSSPLSPTVLHIKNCDTNETITLIVKSNDTIENVKTMVQEKEGIPSNQQKLALDCHELEDGHTLSNYNIQEEAQLDLMLRQGMDIDLYPLRWLDWSPKHL